MNPRLKKSPNPANKRTTLLKTKEKFERLKIELQTMLDDQDAKITVSEKPEKPIVEEDGECHLVVITSQSEAQVKAAVERCTLGLDLESKPFQLVSIRK